MTSSVRAGAKAKAGVRTKGAAPLVTKSAGGRPPKSAEERTVVVTVRLTPQRKERLRALGAGWLAEQIDKATVPPG